MTEVSIEPGVPPDSRIVQSPDAIAADVGGEVVLLHATTGYFHQLNAVGTYLWKQIAQPQSVGELCARALADFDGDEETCRRDIHAFVLLLHGEGLVSIDA